MKRTRNIAVLFAPLLLAAACQVSAQEKTFPLETPMQEDIVACMEEEAAEKLFEIDLQSKHGNLTALPDRCFRFVTTVTYKKLVHSHAVDGITYSVYEATIRSFSVFVPMKGYIHTII